MSTSVVGVKAGPRSLVLRNELKNLGRKTTFTTRAAVASEPSDPPLAAAGDVQLINYYTPALEGGIYTINFGQQIEVPNGAYPASTYSINTAPDNPGPQTFKVVAPRFSIEPNDVHSTYPPQGHADQPMILPHIVFKDPHVPWERSLAIREKFQDDDVMPWMAVAPFDINGWDTPQELRLTAEQLNGPTAIYAPTDGSTVTQSTTAAISMPLSKYFQLGSNASSGGTRVHIPSFSQDLDWANLQNDMTPVQVIFLSGSLFKDLFLSRSNSQVLDVSQYRYCAHVRNINTQGMADAGVEDTGLFSIIHSLRTGPTDIAPNTLPRTQAVHLLNLEYIESMPLPPARDLVALISLYSWTYLCQPPLSVNFVDAMRHIGDQIKNETSLLRYSDATLAQLSSVAGQGGFQNVTDPSEAETLRAIMKERFSNGYSLVRHRTAPGQVSVAFTRSPLVPVIVPRPSALPDFSNNGQDYQILDQRIGILDISYSSAFQFGKTLASTDMGFVAALMRIRGDVHTAGAAVADAIVADPAVTATNKVSVVSNLQATTTRIVQLSKMSEDTGAPTLKNRWSQAQKIVAKCSRDVNDPKWKNAYVKGVKDRIAILASAAPRKNEHDSPAGQRLSNLNDMASTTPRTFAARSLATAEPQVQSPYNDLASPVSTDWAFLFNWIMDKLFLDTLPFHYLVTDSAHLPAESIRFFHIDPTWLDCSIDGALSVANHLSSDDDVIRQLVKVEINRYLRTPTGQGSTAHLPQIPLYGFFLRSAVVKVFPDLQIDIPYTAGEGNGLAPILVQKRMSSDILMVLLDRLPDGGQIDSIRFTQPVHQQCFSAGDSLDANQIEFLFRKVYRTSATQAAATDALHEIGGPHVFQRSNRSKVIYDWSSQCLNFATIEQELFNSPSGLVTNMPDEWGAPVQPLLTSSMTGIQLNDTIKYLEILPAANFKPSPSGITLPRQIYVGSLPTASARLAPFAPQSISTARRVVTEESSTNAPEIPIVEQQLPKRLAKGSAKIQPRSLSETPPELNTITGSKVTTRAAISGSSSAGSFSPRATIAGQGSAKSSAAGAASGKASIQGLAPGNNAAGIATSASPSKDPFPYPPGLNAFQYAIYPSTTVYKPSSLAPPCFVDTTNPFPPDIIFSINLTSKLLPPLQDLQLHEIDFRIPIGDPSKRKDQNSDILGGVGLVPINSSPGVSARMLSNQRWVVHMDVQPTYLNLRIIPRTLNLAVPIAQNTTLSFRLNEVEIAGPDGKSTSSGLSPVFVNIGVTEVYGFFSDPSTKTKWVNQGSAYQQLALQRK